VACDYIDITGGGFWESFKAVGNGGTFELKPYWQKIHPMLGENAKAEIIKSVTLYLVPGNSKPISASVKSVGSVIKIDFQGALKKKLDKDYSNGAIFLSLKFNGSAFKGLPGFNQYDFDSPWNIQVGIYSGGFEVTEAPEPKMPSWFKNDPVYTGDFEVMEDPEGKMSSWYKNKKDPVFEENVRRRKQMIADMSSWEIRRHKKDGEVPSFIARVGFNSFEYDNNLDMPK
jgi:hypothetical protein